MPASLRHGARIRPVESRRKAAVSIVIPVYNDARDVDGRLRWRPYGV
jgi:hypothetical protein